MKCSETHLCSNKYYLINVVISLLYTFFPIFFHSEFYFLPPALNYFYVNYLLPYLAKKMPAFSHLAKVLLVFLIYLAIIYCGHPQ